MKWEQACLFLVLYQQADKGDFIPMWQIIKYDMPYVNAVQNELVELNDFS